MTSEEIAKLISASGIAATELVPFASDTLKRDTTALRIRIVLLERVPALAEFAQQALLALDANRSEVPTPNLERKLADLRAAATALLRYLHGSNGLQYVGSRHAIWVKIPTPVPLGEFADCVLRIYRAINSLATIPQIGGTVTLEATDGGPFWLRIGLGNQSACELIASAAHSAMRHRADMLTQSSKSPRDVDIYARSKEAQRLALLYLDNTAASLEIRLIQDAVLELALLLNSGVEIQLNSTQSNGISASPA